MSNQKRELQKKRQQKAIKKAKAKKSLISILIGVAALLLVSVIGYIIYYKVVLMTNPIENYSEGLAEDGTIEGIVAKDYVTLGQYEGIEINYSEYAPTQEDIDAHIAGLVATYKEYSTEAGVKVELHDTINLDYVGKIDGVAFEGGSTAEGGTQITVGEAGYIDDFEDQLVGKEIGSSFDIEVTFPEDYGNEEVAGKDAVFSITLNGIYTEREFDDAFVKDNLSDVALTADAYIEYYKEQQYLIALEKYVPTYLEENCVVPVTPKEYVEDIMGITKYADQQEMEYMNEYYAAYFGGDMYESLADYMGVESETEYEAELRLRAEEEVEANLVIQAIYEDAGLTITSDHIEAVLTDMGGSMENIAQLEAVYGKGYINQQAMKEAVYEYIMENAEIVK